MVRLLETVAQVAPTEATVLITGDSGTGKEMIAGALHFNSPRKGFPFVKINCAAITETLLESELFGHEKGAFTGAYKRKEGKFSQAHRGTLFLDEISEMSQAMQVKLLRVLQERELTRVGGEEVLRIDVRLIAATNKDLLSEIESHRFRDDLYYRLNVVNLIVPPLRDRREDIPLLAQHFLRHFAEKNRKNMKGLTPQAMDRLLRYDWPGNVRELMNVVERGVVLARSEFIDEEQLPLIPEAEGGRMSPKGDVPGDLSLDEVERTTILNTLESVGGNKSEAARRLGITRKTLHAKLKKYGIPSE
jgi:two-component system response regulator HydG